MMKMETSERRLQALIMAHAQISDLLLQKDSAGLSSAYAALLKLARPK